MNNEHCHCGHEHDHSHPHEEAGHPLDRFDEEEDVVTLVDEDGIEHRFEIADVLEENGVYYTALIPVFDTAEELLDDTGELVVLKVVAEGAQEYLEVIEDEAEFDRISKQFMERLGDEYDFEE